MPPEPLLSLAIDPDDSSRIVVSGEQALYLSTDAGRSWRRTGGEPALLAWPPRGALSAVAFDGSVRRRVDEGRNWRKAGDVGGEPAAFEAAAPAELYVALHDGTIKRSTDGGRSWSVRSAP